MAVFEFDLTLTYSGEGAPVVNPDWVVLGRTTVYDSRFDPYYEDEAQIEFALSRASWHPPEWTVSQNSPSSPAIVTFDISDENITNLTLFYYAFGDGTNIYEYSGTLREAARIASFIDPSNALYTAANANADVHVYCFRSGVDSRERLGTVASAKNPSLFQKASGEIVLGVTDRTSGDFVRRESADFGRSFA
jgi:hypothetical protein